MQKNRQTLCCRGYVICCQEYAIGAMLSEICYRCYAVGDILLGETLFYSYM